MIKLITFNVWQGRIIQHVIRFLEAEQPDIVCLQEVYSAKEAVPTWNAFSTLELIQQTLPDYHTFFAPAYGFSVAGRPVVFGNAILSKFPIFDERIEFTHGHLVPDLAIEELEPNTRNFQVCRLKLPQGGSLHVINHHGYWDRNPLGVPETTQKMQKVKQAAEHIEGPLVITGDLNVTPESEAMQLFNGMLTNLTEESGAVTTLSPLGPAFDHDNRVPCDHILVNKQVRVAEFTVRDDVVASDHLPLVVRFTV